MKDQLKNGLFIVLLLWSNILSGQVYSSGTALDTIPFRLTPQNNISIKAVLNGVDTVQLMFHTAANGVTLIKQATKNMDGISWGQGDQVKSWGGENEARFSENNTLQIAGFQWDSVTIWENENSGPGTDGKFGPNLFAGKTLELDFDNSWLIIHRALPLKAKKYKKCPLIFDNDFLFVEGISKVGHRKYPNRFLIHSGYGGALLYDDQFVADSEIGDHIQITDQQELKDAYGNVLKTNKGILPKFKIGGVTFKEVPVGFFEGSIGRQKMSVLGGGLLKRFNLIIDSQRANIYLRPNHYKRQ